MNLSLHTNEDGAALVEFVLILPVVLLLLLGILDAGRAYNYWIDETHLANQAARFAAVNSNPGGSQSLQAYIKAQADTPELRGGGTASVPGSMQVCVDFPTGTSNVGDPVRVTTSVTYNWLPFLSGRTGIARSTLTGQAVMRLEAKPSNFSAGCA
jgi:Flp pilus assembly protein TadG